MLQYLAGLKKSDLCGEALWQRHTQLVQYRGACVPRPQTSATGIAPFRSAPNVREVVGLKSTWVFAHCCTLPQLVPTASSIHFCIKIFTPRSFSCLDTSQLLSGSCEHRPCGCISDTSSKACQKQGLPAIPRRNGYYCIHLGNILKTLAEMRLHSCRVFGLRQYF